MKKLLYLIVFLRISFLANAQIITPKNLFLNGSMGLSERNYSVADSMKLLNLGTAITALTKSNYINLSDYAKSDGSDQATQIQNAVNAAQTQGKALYIPQGTFCTLNTITITSSNLTIYGDGNGSVIKALNTSPTPTSGLSAMRVLMQVNYRQEWYGRAQDRLSNINLHGFSLDMSAVIPDYQSGWNDGIIGRGALFCTSVDHMNIENIFINEAVTSGLTLTSCFNVKVTKVTVNGLRAKILGYNHIYDGNGINIHAISSDSYSYTGPIGSISLDNCTVIGSTSTFSIAITNNVPSSGANIGINTDLGGVTENRKLKNVSVTNCKVLKWYWAIMAEGTNEGGAGDVLISGNTVDEAVHGIWLFANSSGTASNSKNVLISNNRIKNIQHTPIAIWGIQSSIIGNHITNWAIAPSNSPLTGVAGIDGTAAAIYVLPHPNGYTGALTGSDYIIANNVCINEYVNTNAYAFIPVGGWLRAYNSGQVLNNALIEGNMFDMGNVTHTLSTGSVYASGVLLDGKITNCSFRNNTVKGAGFSAMCCLVGNLTDGIENFTISNNRFINNNFAGGAGDNVLRIYTANTGIRIEDNEFIETSGSRMGQAILFEGNANADVEADYVTIRNNKVRGIGDNINVFTLNITGANIVIEGNENYNYRTTAPSSSSYRGFKGTTIYNKDVAPTGIYGWICTTTGKPGIWTPLYLYDPSRVTNTLTRTSYMEALGNNTAVTLSGIGINFQGTATARNVSNTNFFSRRRRVGYVSSTTANANFGVIGNAQFLSIEGFSVRFVFGIQAYNSGHQYSIGLGNYYDNTVAASTLTQCLHIYADAGDTTFKIRGAGGGVGSVIDLGANFPSNTSEVDIYDVSFTMLAGSNVASYIIKRLNTGDVATGTVTTVPSSGTLLSLRCVGNIRSTGIVGGLDITRISITTDY